MSRARSQPAKIRIYIYAFMHTPNSSSNKSIRPSLLRHKHGTGMAGFGGETLTGQTAANPKILHATFHADRARDCFGTHWKFSDLVATGQPQAAGHIHREQDQCPSLTDRAALRAAIIVAAKAMAETEIDGKRKVTGIGTILTTVPAGMMENTARGNCSGPIAH